jgi:predicted lysophospholipase L1 biosynthesis ABC-type transport system permease subunit
MTYELRTAGDPLGYVRTVREIAREADPRLPLSQIQTEKALIDGTMNEQVIFARLCTGFAFLALTIACVGLYGAMSYNVARRTREIGIRMALGAARGRVVWMVLGEVLLLAAAGIAISVPAALYGTKILKSFLCARRSRTTRYPSSDPPRASYSQPPWQAISQRGMPRGSTRRRRYGTNKCSAPDYLSNSGLFMSRYTVFGPLPE